MRFRLLAAASASLAGLATAEPAWAQCTTNTAGGVTTISCGDTATTNSLNENQDNPSSTAYWHRFATTIDTNIPQDATITGRGLRIEGTGDNPITVTNEGAVTHTAGETANGQPANGLSIVGNGGLITYLGNGSATTNATPPQLATGLSITNSNGGGINIGSQAAPVTGTFSGEGAVVVRAPSGSFINAFFDGGTFTATNQANDALELADLGDVNVVMTGQSVLTGGLNVGVYFNAPAASIVSVDTDAQILVSSGPAMLVSGASGGTNVSVATGASITGQAAGIAMFALGGEVRLTTAEGSTIEATGASGLGVQLQPDAGSIVADLSGSITSGGAGLFLAPADGSVSVTIREGGSVSGNEVGITVLRLANNAGVVDLLNLGTISSPDTAASFDGTLRIGNGGTTGTIEGDIDNRGTLIFNRSDALTYDGDVSGTGALTQQGTGTLTLTGTSTYSGATSVADGTLVVDGSLTSAVTVADGARFGGSGSVDALTVSGELAPGGSGTIGTLTVDGNLVLNAGSHFIVDVGPGTSDLLSVAGTASLAGQLSAIAAGGAFTAGSYTLLTAGGGLSGTFNPLTTQPDGPVSLRYDANNVYLDVAQSTIFTTTDQTTLVFLTPTVTLDQRSVFSTRLLARLEGGTPLYDQNFDLAFEDPAVQAGVTAARAAITTFGGPGVIIADPVRTSRTVTSQTVEGTSTFALASNNVTTTDETTTGPATIQTGAVTGCQAAAQALAQAPSTTRPVCTPDPQTTVIPTGNTGLDTVSTGEYRISETRTDIVTETISETWELNGRVTEIGTIHAEVQSGLFDLGGRLLRRLSAIEVGKAGWGEVYRFRVSQSGRRDAWGMAGGFGLTVAPGLTLAAGVDRGELDIDVPGALEEGEVTLTEFGAALRLDRGPFSASLAGVHGFGDAETRRTIIGISDADYDVRLTGVAFEISYAIDTAGWMLRPGAGLDYLRVSSDAFTESDTLGLAVADETADRVRASAGLAVERDFGSFVLAASARYLAVLDGGERSIPVVFAVAPGRTLEMSGPGEPDGALLGARLFIPLAPGAMLSFGYDGRFGGDYEEHAGSVGLRIAL